jgi:hypothetical protein
MQPSPSLGAELPEVEFGGAGLEDLVTDAGSPRDLITGDEASFLSWAGGVALGARLQKEEPPPSRSTMLRRWWNLSGYAEPEIADYSGADQLEVDQGRRD